VSELREARLALLFATNRAVVAKDKGDQATYEQALAAIEQARHHHRQLVERLK
jgi:multidrug efflux pump subunit AcrA (membrane-fusion protein)